MWMMVCGAECAKVIINVHGGQTLGCASIFPSATAAGPLTIGAFLRQTGNKAIEKIENVGAARKA